MKVICKQTSYWIDSYEFVDLKLYITKDKIYEVLESNSWGHYNEFETYRIINDHGKEHDISKECFELLRDINIDKLLK